jgi:hypothetical protein
MKTLMKPQPIVLLSVLAACGDAASTASAPVVRDSAGITIVENFAPMWREGEAWRLSPEPIDDIGVVDGDPAYQLFQVSVAVRLSDGSVIVANRGSHQLRYFDAGGSHLTSAGGQGGGPGEFADLRWVGLMPGDSVIAYDIAHRRLSVFDSHGIFQRSATVQGPQFFAHGVFADGSVLMYRPENREEGVTRRTIIAVRYGSDGILLDSIVSLPGPELVIESKERTLPRGGGVYAYWTSQDLVFGHNSVLAVAGMHLYAGTQDRYEIDVWDTTGTMVTSVRAAHESVPVTQAQVDAYKAEALAASSGEHGAEEDIAEHRKSLEEAPHSEVFPAYGSIVIDAEGNLWVEVYRPPGDDHPRWTVFDAGHRMLGTVETPQNFTVFQIGADFVLGKSTDDLGVEHVQLYTLIKPR